MPWATWSDISYYLLLTLEHCIQPLRYSSCCCSYSEQLVEFELFFRSLLKCTPLARKVAKDWAASWAAHLLESLIRVHVRTFWSKCTGFLRKARRVLLVRLEAQHNVGFIQTHPLLQLAHIFCSLSVWISLPFTCTFTRSCDVSHSLLTAIVAYWLFDEAEHAVTWHCF